MANNEIKPSFSLKYLILTALTAGIIGGVGFALSKLYESRPILELTVANGYSINVIGETTLPTDTFEIEYYTKGQERKKISSLFRKKVIIKNTGNIGVSDLNVTAVLKDKEVALTDLPKIESDPVNIINAISIIKSDKSTNKKHDWIISLLNPGESISFDYSAFSEQSIDKISLDVIPRKQDWKVKYQELALLEKSSLANLIIIGSGGLVFILVVPFVIAFPFYRHQWNNRPDYRDRYVSFNRFFNDHKPWELFKPKADSLKKD